MNKNLYRALPGLLLLLTGLLFSTGAAANLFSVYIDADQNPATGCSVALETGAPAAGVEFAITAGVNTASPPQVILVKLAECSGTALGSAQRLPAGIPVGIDLGLDGSDVVEFSADLEALGLSIAEVVNLIVVGTDPQGGSVRTDVPGAGLEVPPEPIPTLSTLSFCC